MAKAKEKEKKPKKVKVRVASPRMGLLTVPIVGTSPVIVHALSEKMRKEWLEKYITKEDKKNRTEKEEKVRDPTEEYLDSMYYMPGTRDTDKPEYALLASGFHRAMQTVGSMIYNQHGKTLGVNATSVQRSVTVHSVIDGLIPMTTKSGPKMREDWVRIGNNSTPDLRYRAQFDDWSMTVPIQFDMDVFSAEEVFNMFSRAGMVVGYGDWRLEKGGEFGAWACDAAKTTFQEIRIKQQQFIVKKAKVA